MKAILENWWMALLAAMFSGIGWFAKDINLNGVSGATEPMTLGGLTIGGVCALLWMAMNKWQAAGGKLDGKLTPEEFKALAETITAKLAPQLTPLVDKLAVPASNTINSIIGPNAANLIQSLLSWFQDKTPDPNEQALNFTVLHMLEDAQGLKGNEKALAAIAVLKSEVAAAALLPPSAVSLT